MNNYEKYFGNIDKAAKTIVNEGACEWCSSINERLFTGKCDECCEQHAKEFLEKEIKTKTKKVRNCDLYKTAKELNAAFEIFCGKKHCDRCKYGVNHHCRLDFAYDYVEVVEE